MTIEKQAPALLCEWFPVGVDPESLVEKAGAGSRAVLLSGVIQRADAENHNGRVYPRRVLEREVERYQDVIRGKRAFGELDHPETSTIQLEKVSHVMRRVWWQGDDVMGQVEVLQTPCGRILESLVRAGVTVGISSRGVGSTSKNEGGKDAVQDDFSLVCWDIVAEPSTNEAFLFAEGRRRARSSSAVGSVEALDRLIDGLRAGRITSR